MVFSSLESKIIRRHRLLRHRRIRRIRRMNQYEPLFKCAMWSDILLTKKSQFRGPEFENFVADLMSNFKSHNIPKSSCDCVQCWYKSVINYIAQVFKFVQYMDVFCSKCNIVHLSLRSDFRLITQCIFKNQIVTVIV